MATTSRLKTKLDDFDRRRSPRFKKEVKGTLEFINSESGKIESRLCSITAISEMGFSISLSHLKSLPRILHIEAQINDFDANLKAMCSIQWQKWDSSTQVLKCGVKIAEIQDAYLRLLREHLAKLPPNKDLLNDRRGKGIVKSEDWHLVNSRGLRIRGISDCCPSLKSKGTVVVTSAFGKSKADAVPLSYLLATNGWRVLRYDPTNHIGESDGSPENCLLDELEADLACVVSSIFSKPGTRELVILVSAGLMSRVAVRACSKDLQVAQLICIAPVLDINKTISDIYSYPLSGGSELLGKIDLLGVPILGELFMRNIKSSLYDDAGTLADELIAVQDRISIVDAKSVGVDLIKQTHKVSSTVNAVAGYSHMSDDVLLAAVGMTNAGVRGKRRVDKEEALHYREVLAQQSIERERLRSRSLLKGKESDMEFWGKYLEQFRFIINVPEYRLFYEDIMESMGLNAPHGRILDAGCGNGSFGLWLLSLVEQSTEPRFEYVGLDLVPEALDCAMRSHAGMIEKMKAKDDLSFHYNLADLCKPLPFLDNYFDHVCSNLVLCYLSDPVQAFKELFRVLKKGHSLVVTSIRPDPDFSGIYRNTLKYCQTDADRKAARRLLNNVAGIVEKERLGIYKFFDNRELSNLANSVSCESFEITDTFGDQAKILSVIKPSA
jgi:ubiquinone/menaquinone biosynthesis C-methylase UbiE